MKYPTLNDVLRQQTIIFLFIKSMDTTTMTTTIEAAAAAHTQITYTQIESIRTEEKFVSEYIYIFFVSLSYDVCSHHIFMTHIAK